MREQLARADWRRYRQEVATGAGLLAALICLGAAVGCAWGALTMPRD